MKIEIAERIAKGNKAYYATAKLIKSKFLKKNTKMKIHKTMIRPVLMNSSEAWTLTAKDDKNLCIFERQILRKIFRPINFENIRRIRNNMGIDKLIEGADIVRFIKAQRIKRLATTNGPNKTNQKAIRLETYGKQSSRKTKTTMARGWHGRSKKAESKKLEGDG